MYCTITIFKKSIFLWFTAKFTRVDPEKVDNSLVNVCYLVSSKLKYQQKLPHVLVADGQFVLSLFISGELFVPKTL